MNADEAEKAVGVGCFGVDLESLIGAVGDEGAAGLGRRDREGGVVLGQVALGDKRLAASMPVIPASASSFGRRSWRVRKARSERPRASGE